ncbi:MAG: NTP transferase domain-containing protein [Bacteroidales bacterium]|nr:NTP transferase domain-containing protein [Bacteroidales bacterium]
MKAFIFAAGLGTRLQPYTLNQPKALVPVNGKPMLEHLILKLNKFGIREITINIHHFGDQIIDFLNHHDHFGCKINISDEREQLLDTGGGLKKALSFLNDGEDLLVHNVDIWSNYDLELLINHHQKKDSLATLVVEKRETSRYLLFSKDGNFLKGWINKNTGEKLPENIDINQYDQFAFNGIHIVNQKVLKFFPSIDKFSIIPTYLELAQSQKIQALEIEDAYWMDIGKPEQLAKAELFINTSPL